MKLLEVTEENIFNQIKLSTLELREAGRVFKTNNLRDLSGTFNCTYSFQDAVKSLLKEGKIKLIASFTLPPNKELTTAQKRDLDLILNNTDWSLCNVNPFNVIIKANTRGCNTRVLNSLVKKGFLAEKDYDHFEELYIKEGVRKREFLITAKALTIQVFLTPNHEYNFKKEEIQEERSNIESALLALYLACKDQNFVKLDQIKKTIKEFSSDDLLKWGSLDLKYKAYKVAKEIVFGVCLKSVFACLSNADQNRITRYNERKRKEEELALILKTTEDETQEPTQEPTQTPLEKDALKLIEWKKSLPKALDEAFMKLGLKNEELMVIESLMSEVYADPDERMYSEITKKELIEVINKRWCEKSLGTKATTLLNRLIRKGVLDLEKREVCEGGGAKVVWLNEELDMDASITY